eukprot:NODE_5246_length_721_cov_13.415179_g4414_i0.p1 GENE.NODE_5246_length_721_cov_13.415179_g4414_i0~~NODE_5246_length_721_cov_13.415179_g4414_i0.p1  ORF type:complete len:221 (+),score=41.81 NODE_5246_length_721_cov_13.415179_g4414_i0:101-664(+)
MKGIVGPNVFTYCLDSLQPNTRYQVSVITKLPADAPKPRGNGRRCKVLRFATMQVDPKDRPLSRSLRDAPKALRDAATDLRPLNLPVRPGIPVDPPFSSKFKRLKRDKGSTAPAGYPIHAPQERIASTLPPMHSDLQAGSSAPKSSARTSASASSRSSASSAASSSSSASSGTLSSSSSTASSSTSS